MNVFIYRHGQTDYNAQKIVQGRGVDVSLNAIGQEQARSFYDTYSHIPFDLVLTSCLKRTIETAQPFIIKGYPHIAKAEIDEISWGIFEGKKSDNSMHDRYRSLLTSWSKGHYDHRIEEGDSALDMKDRLVRFVSFLKQLPFNNVLVCTHGGSLCFLTTILMQEPLSDMIKYKIQNTGLCHFTYDKQMDRFNLITFNNVDHLSS